MTSTRTTSTPIRRHTALALGAMALLWPAITAAQTVAPNATTIAGTYYDSAFKACSNVGSCEVLLASVPIGKTLLVQRVSCVLFLPSTAKIGYLMLRRKISSGSVQGSQFLAPVQEMSDSLGSKNYLLNAESMIAMGGNDRPAIFISLRATSFNATCSVHGTIS